MRYSLTISCKEDKPGIVAAVSQFIAKNQGSITVADQHSMGLENAFFMRYEVASKADPATLNAFITQFKEDIATPFNMTFQCHNQAIKPRVLILASKGGHCLEEILGRFKNNTLNGEVLGVISNHQTLAKRVAWYDTPFHHFPSDDKAAHFDALAQCIDDYKPDVIVLARYMQILPPALCERYSGKIINIHHSFLPAFVGAKPYHQAYEKGVKLIGATCHYVTSDLDQGPIIEQDVIRISHRQSVDDLVRLGKDIERRVLTKGLKLHLESRVIIHDNKTIVFYS